MPAASRALSYTIEHVTRTLQERFLAASMHWQDSTLETKGHHIDSTDTGSSLASRYLAESEASHSGLNHFIDSKQAKVTACIFAFLAIVLSIGLLYRHLQYYTRPQLQRQIIRIILIIPVYALCSALSLLLDEYSIYINTVRDVYEAYCIHCFLALMLDYPGGEHAVVNGIRELPLLKHPFPLCFLPRMRLGVDFIINMKRTTLQFVVLKPLMAIISIILMLAGQFDTIWWQVILLVVYNLSYSIALYGLYLFYLATKNLLDGFSPVKKFTAVKIPVFFTYYQSLLVVMIPGMDTLGSSEKWNSYITCIEMALFALLHIYAFDYREFLPGGVGLKNMHASGEFTNIRVDPSVNAAFSRMGDAFNIVDTWDDIKRNFKLNAGRHIMIGQDGGILEEGTARRIEEEEEERRQRELQEARERGERMNSADRREPKPGIASIAQTKASEVVKESIQLLSDISHKLHLDAIPVTLGITRHNRRSSSNAEDKDGQETDDSAIVKSKYKRTTILKKLGAASTTTVRQMREEQELNEAATTININVADDEAYGFISAPIEAVPTPAIDSVSINFTEKIVASQPSSTINTASASVPRESFPSLTNSTTPRSGFAASVSPAISTSPISVQTQSAQSSQTPRDSDAVVGAPDAFTAHLASSPITFDPQFDGISDTHLPEPVFNEISTSEFDFVQESLVTEVVMDNDTQGFTATPNEQGQIELTSVVAPIPPRGTQISVEQPGSPKEDSLNALSVKSAVPSVESPLATDVFPNNKQIESITSPQSIATSSSMSPISRLNALTVSETTKRMEQPQGIFEVEFPDSTAPQELEHTSPKQDNSFPPDFDPFSSTQPELSPATRNVLDVGTIDMRTLSDSEIDAFPETGYDFAFAEPNLYPDEANRYPFAEIQDDAMGIDVDHMDADSQLSSEMDERDQLALEAEVTRVRQAGEIERFANIGEARTGMNDDWGQGYDPFEESGGSAVSEKQPFGEIEFPPQELIDNSPIRIDTEELSDPWSAAVSAVVGESFPDVQSSPLASFNPFEQDLSMVSSFPGAESTSNIVATSIEAPLASYESPFDVDWAASVESAADPQPSASTTTEEMDDADLL